MDKHWKIIGTKPDSNKVVLFTTTTEESIAADLAVGIRASLILIQRGHRNARVEGSAEESHRDLARGAFEAHCRNREINCRNAAMESVNSVPQRVPDNYVGGDGKSFFVPIWEEASN